MSAVVLDEHPTAPVVRIDRLEVVPLTAGSWSLGGSPAGASFDVIHPLGGAVLLGDERYELAGGRIAMVETADALRIEVPAGVELVIVRIPESAAGQHEASLRAACGRVHVAASGTSGLVAHLLRGLAAQSGDTERGARLAQHIVGLIGLMCLDLVGDETDWRTDMLRRTTDYIEEHLAELDLTPDRIAFAQNISTRTLHRLFEREQTTLGAWIRARRLEHCRTDLSDPALADLSVSAIGARWGLWDAAHFSRLFKSTFGASPRAYRQAACA
jgi:AraC-like DNA-binding protein